MSRLFAQFWMEVVFCESRTRLVMRDVFPRSGQIRFQIGSLLSCGGSLVAREPDQARHARCFSSQWTTDSKWTVCMLSVGRVVMSESLIRFDVRDASPCDRKWAATLWIFPLFLVVAPTLGTPVVEERRHGPVGILERAAHIVVCVTPSRVGFSLSSNWMWFRGRHLSVHVSTLGFAHTLVSQRDYAFPSMVPRKRLIRA